MLMATDFKSIMEDMGYQFHNKVNDTVAIIYKDPLVISDIVLLFNKKEKYATGLIKPLTVIYDLDQISHQYELFRKMQNDIKFFAQILKYDIIW